MDKQQLPKNAKRVFKGKIFDVYQWDQKMFDNSVEIFEKMKRTDTNVGRKCKAINPLEKIVRKVYAYIARDCKKTNKQYFLSLNI